MTEGIDYRFASDAINFVAEHGMQRLRRPLDGNMKLGARSSFLRCELPLNLCECQFEPHGFAFRRPQSLQCVAALRTDMRHHFEYVTQLPLDRRLGRQLVR